MTNLNFESLRENDIVSRIKIDKNFELNKEDFILQTYFLDSDVLYATLKHLELGYFYKTSFPLKTNISIDIENMALYSTSKEINREDINNLLLELEEYFSKEHRRFLKESENAFIKRENIKNLMNKEFFYENN